MLFIFLVHNVYERAISEARGDVGYPFNWLKPPVIFYITDRSKAVLLIRFFVFAYFGFSFCTVFTFYVSSIYLVKYR